MYSTNNTLSAFRKLIILENFFCINRSYLISSSKKRHFCNFIFFSLIFILIATIIYEFHLNIQQSISVISIQTVVSFEVVCLSVAARRKNSLNSVTRLDEKCGVDNGYLKRIQASVSKTVFIGVVSSILDVAGAMSVVSKPSAVIVLCIATAAHDTEMAFYSILFEGINLRLSAIDKMPIFTGWKVYRHVLITALDLSEEFTGTILLMLASTLLTTVVYSVVLLVADPEMIPRLAVVLIWRELKALYSLWVLCATAAETKSICEHLSFVLASRLALYSKGLKTSQYKATRQLLSCLRSQRPRYLSGMILSINLGLPLDLIDLSVNYLLIIVQIYIAFK